MGQSPPSATYNYENEGLPFFQGKTDFGLIYPTKRVWCNEPKKIVNKDEILLSVRAPVGPTNIALEKSCIGRGLCGLKYIIDENSKFIFYFFRSIEKELSQLGTGSTFQAISKSQISNLKFPLPPLPEQHRIVAKLEELFTKLDVSVAELKKAKAQIKRYRQSVLKYAFEGRLTEQWRIANGELRNETAEELLAKIKKERKKALGKKYKELPPVDTTNLPQLPENWKWISLGEVTDINMGQSPPGDSYNTFGDGVPLINGPVEFGDTPFSNTRAIKFTTKVTKMCKENDLILCVRGSTTGRMNIAGQDACIGRGVASIRAYFYQPYINYYIHSIQIKIFDLGTGSTFPNVSFDVLKGIAISICSIKEQQQIVSEIERHFSVADETEKIIDQSLKQAERLRQSILKDAFSGKLVPQDPSDEPAEKLLERIRAERTKLTPAKKAKRDMKKK